MYRQALEIKMNPKQVEAIKKQEKMRKLIETKQKLDSQLNETLMVKEEVDLLEKDAVIYKLVGPLMVQQDLPEVKKTIQDRMTYLKDNIEYSEKAIKAEHTALS